MLVKYDDEYRNALYKAQKTDNSEDLVTVFKKCQNRLDEKLEKYKNLLEQVDIDIKN